MRKGIEDLLKKIQELVAESRGATVLSSQYGTIATVCEASREMKDQAIDRIHGIAKDHFSRGSRGRTGMIAIQNIIDQALQSESKEAEKEAHEPAISIAD